MAWTRSPVDDESSIPVEVAPALPVLLVDGAPGSEPFRGPTDFLRAALAPTGDDTPQVRARVIASDRLTADAMRGHRVVVLAGVERLSPGQSAAVGAFIEAGGGVLVVPGRTLDAPLLERPGLDARPVRRTGSATRPIARRSPTPRRGRFTGPVMSPFGQGDDPPLAGADFFAYRRLIAADGAAVPARLDTGDPWLVEQPGRPRTRRGAAPLRSTPTRGPCRSTRTSCRWPTS